jgi:sugar phosphate isomerase/epimerase
VHAKDTLGEVEASARAGINGWWRYGIPGSGSIRWGEYINHLRMNGYHGVLSIEHEGGALSREKGFVLAPGTSRSSVDLAWISKAPATIHQRNPDEPRSAPSVAK